MENKNTIREISLTELFPEVVGKKMSGWRFVQMCAVRADEGYEQPSLIRFSEAYLSTEKINAAGATAAFGGAANRGYGARYNKDDQMNPTYWFNIIIKPQADYKMSLDQLSFYLRSSSYNQLEA